MRQGNTGTTLLITCITPTRNERETAISSLIASVGVHKLSLVTGEEGLATELFPGVGVGSNDREPTSRSQTCATIKQITAKLPAT